MDTLFYSVNGQASVGPVSRQAFFQLNLPPTTMVWFEGQPTWRSAGDIPELADFYAPMPAHQPMPPPVFIPQPHPVQPLYAPVRPQATSQRYILYAVGGIVLLFLLVKFAGKGGKDPAREPYVQTYASNFSAKLMRATYPFTGKNPEYKVVDWSYDDNAYTIDLNTYWDGSCTLFDESCNVGYTVQMHVSEGGKFIDYTINDRNACANQHRICDIALGTIMNALQDESLK